MFLCCAANGAVARNGQNADQAVPGANSIGQLRFKTTKLASKLVPFYNMGLEQRSDDDAEESGRRADDIARSLSKLMSNGSVVNTGGVSSEVVQQLKIENNNLYVLRRIIDQGGNFNIGLLAIQRLIPRLHLGKRTFITGTVDPATFNYIWHTFATDDDPNAEDITVLNPDYIDPTFVGINVRGMREAGTRVRLGDQDRTTPYICINRDPEAVILAEHMDKYGFTIGGYVSGGNTPCMPRQLMDKVALRVRETMRDEVGDADALPQYPRDAYSTIHTAEMSRVLADVRAGHGGVNQVRLLDQSNKLSEYIAKWKTQFEEEFAKPRPPRPPSPLDEEEEMIRQLQAEEEEMKFDDDDEPTQEPAEANDTKERPRDSRMDTDMMDADSEDDRVRACAEQRKRHHAEITRSVPSVFDRLLAHCLTDPERQHNTEGNDTDTDDDGVVCLREAARSNGKKKRASNERCDN